MYLGDDRREVLGNKNTIVQALNIYRGVEVASHTRNHAPLLKCDRVRVLEEIVYDYLRLEDIFGQKIVGMAYPGRIPNYDEALAQFIAQYTSVCFARTTLCTHRFDFPVDFMQWHPTMQILDVQAEDIVEKFSDCQEDALLFLWGHAFELDYDETRWSRVEKLFARIAQIENAVCLPCGEVYRRYHARTTGSQTDG